jgi:hypothetical protein
MEGVKRIDAIEYVDAIGYNALEEDQATSRRKRHGNEI